MDPNAGQYAVQNMAGGLGQAVGPVPIGVGAPTLARRAITDTLSEALATLNRIESTLGELDHRISMPRPQAITNGGQAANSYDVKEPSATSVEHLANWLSQRAAAIEARANQLLSAI